MISNTLLKRNIDEAVEAVDFWEAYGFDKLNFIVMVIRNNSELLLGESLSSVIDYTYEKLYEAAKRVIEKEYKITLSSSIFNRAFELRTFHPENFFYDNVKSNNPQSRFSIEPRSYLQNGSFPGMHVDCRSPFKFARILFNGDVQLCYQFTIGNIHNNNFTDIWYGEEAQRVRSALLRNAKNCNACDYYRFGIKAPEVSYEDENNFYNAEMLNELKVYRKPEFIEDCHSYNIVAWMGDYYGLPKELGSIDIRIADLSNLKEVIINSSLDQVKSSIIEKIYSNLEQTKLEVERLCGGYKNATFIESIEAYNIVAWQGKYYGIPQELGSVDIMTDDMSTLKGVFVDISIERLKQVIQNYLDLIAEIERSNLEIERSHAQIREMESSKFWKLRSAWLRLKDTIKLSKK